MFEIVQMMLFLYLLIIPPLPPPRAEMRDYLFQTPNSRAGFSKSQLLGLFFWFVFFMSVTRYASRSTCGMALTFDPASLGVAPKVFCTECTHAAC